MKVSAKWDALVSWSQARGVSINDVEAQTIPGRGTGMVATRDIEVGTEIINVPFNALIHPACSIPLSFVMELHSDPHANRRAPSRKTRPTMELPKGIYGLDREITTHGVIAAHLTYDTSAAVRYNKWKLTWPGMVDFREGMPFLWPEDLSEKKCGSCLRAGILDRVCDHGDEATVVLLPPEIGGSWSFSKDSEPGKDPMRAKSRPGKIHGMREKLLKDWAAVKKSSLAQGRTFKPMVGDHLDGVDELFLYHWCIVNTRSFYFLLDGEEPPANSDDAMVLCPVIDLFNHTEKNLDIDGKETCSVSFSDNGFTVSTRQPVRAGEELYVSYGPHGNDLLLAEYGFILSQNHHDTLYLDDIVLRDFTADQRVILEQHGYLGQYALQYPQPPSTAPEACYRTIVAAHLLLLKPADWLAYINDSSYPYPSTHISSLATAHDHIAKWIGVYREEASRTIEVLNVMDANSVVQVFGDSQGKDKERRRTALARHGLVSRRWQEVWEMCWRAEEELQKDRTEEMDASR